MEMQSELVCLLTSVSGYIVMSSSLFEDSEYVFPLQCIECKINLDELFC